MHRPIHWVINLHKFRVPNNSSCSVDRNYFLFFVGPWPPLLGFPNHKQIHGRTPLGEWSARRRGLYLHRTQETNIHALSGIRTRDPSNKVAAELRLRPRSHQDRPVIILLFLKRNSWHLLFLMLWCHL
jgi:hypothetical protein